jgi:hypothetical protein
LTPDTACLSPDFTVSACPNGVPLKEDSREFEARQALVDATNPMALITA